MQKSSIDIVSDHRRGQEIEIMMSRIEVTTLVITTTRWQHPRCVMYEIVHVQDRRNFFDFLRCPEKVLAG